MIINQEQINSTVQFAVGMAVLGLISSMIGGMASMMAKVHEEFYGTKELPPRGTGLKERKESTEGRRLGEPKTEVERRETHQRKYGTQELSERGKELESRHSQEDQTEKSNIIPEYKATLPSGVTVIGTIEQIDAIDDLLARCVEEIEERVKLGELPMNPLGKLTVQFHIPEGLFRPEEKQLALYSAKTRTIYLEPDSTEYDFYHELSHYLDDIAGYGIERHKIADVFARKYGIPRKRIAGSSSIHHSSESSLSPKTTKQKAIELMTRLGCDWEVTRAHYPDWGPEIVVFPPEGYTFGEELHALSCRDWEEVLKRLPLYKLTPEKEHHSM